MLIVALVLVTAFFVALEFSLVAIDRSRVEQLAAEGDRRSRIVIGLLRHLTFQLSGAQLGITAASVVLGFVAEPTVAAAIEPLVGRSPSIVLGLVLATVFQMVLGELVPKSFAIARAEATARNLARPATVYGKLFGPVIRLFNAAANGLVRRFGVEPIEELVAVRSLEELEHLIKSSGEGGALAPDAYTLMRRTLRFNEKTAADALVPRVDVKWIHADDPVAALVRLAVEFGFSRFPVCGIDLDDPVGVAHVKDVYRLPFEERASTPVSAIAGPPFVVPETAHLGDLLDDFRAHGNHLAVVVDEYGGTAGILTLEDVLEELVGEIDDEYDPAPPRLSTVLPAGVYGLPGTLHLDEVAEACGLQLPEGPYETLAGFVLTELGRIPEVGDAVEHEGWHIEVAEMDRRRVAAVRLRAPEAKA